MTRILIEGQSNTVKEYVYPYMTYKFLSNPCPRSQSEPHASVPANGHLKHLSIKGF